VNDAPIANADALTRISEDSGARTILASTLLGNDVEGPANEASQTLKIIGVSNAVGGTVKLVAGNIVVHAEPQLQRPASFTYTIQDNGLTNGLADPKTSSAKASFTIGAVNDKPIAKADALTSVAEDSGARTILASPCLGTTRTARPTRPARR
jgi:hypothetical protein